MIFKTTKISKWNAVIISLDGTEYTVTSSEEGGAVVSGKTLKQAKKQFKEAMQLSDAVMKLRMQNQQFLN